jgi:hypothetical protein
MEMEPQLERFAVESLRKEASTQAKDLPAQNSHIDRLLLGSAAVRHPIRCRSAEREER